MADRHEKSRGECKKELLVALHRNYCLQEALDYRRYGLADKSSHYDEAVAQSVNKWANCVLVHMRLHRFESLYLISVLIFLSPIILVCYTNEVHEGVALWLLLFFNTGPSAAVLNAFVGLKSKSHKREKTCTVTPYCEVIHDLLQTYAIDDLIHETDSYLMRLNQLSNKLRTRDTKAICGRSSDATEYLMSMCSMAFLLRVCQNLSAIASVRIGTQKRTLHYTVSRAIRLL